MTDERQVKKIDMDTLNRADRKISTAKLRKLGTAIVVLLFLTGGAYAAYRMFAGEVLASRFTVNQMVCPACIITLQEITKKIPGVVDTQVSLAAQEVIVRYRDKQTNPDQIKQAIGKAGYPVQLDGVFKPEVAGNGNVLVAEVNGKPLLDSDLKLSLDIRTPKISTPKVDAAFFHAVGKQILLRAADEATVIIQPSEITDELKAIAEKQGTSVDELTARMIPKFGSKEKYIQTVGQELGIRKLVDEHVLQNVQDTQEKQRKALEWAGKLFRDADVKLIAEDFQNKLKSVSGQSDWKTLWPHMLSADADLKHLLVP